MIDGSVNSESQPSYASGAMVAKHIVRHAWQGGTRVRILLHTLRGPARPAPRSTPASG